MTRGERVFKWFIVAITIVNAGSAGLLNHLGFLSMSLLATAVGLGMIWGISHGSKP